MYYMPTFYPIYWCQKQLPVGQYLTPLVSENPIDQLPCDTK